MTAVFVHGVPDTVRVWDGVRARLDRTDHDVLGLPGFGTPRPEGFPATKEAYADWLARQLDRFEGPVDLVGHDWGGILVLRLACDLGDRVRSWVAGGSPLDPAYEWHEMARLWQTPDVGEEVIAGLTPDVIRSAMPAMGIPPDAAAVMADSVDDTMRSCILDLYRSAIDISKEWGPDLASLTTPGMLIWGERDEPAPLECGRRMAEASGAALVPLDTDHWWELEQPDRVAAELNRFWASLGAP